MTLSWKKTGRKLLAALSWIITAGLVGWVLATTDFLKLGSALSHADLPVFITLAVSFNIAHLVLDSLGVSVILKRSGLGIPMWKLIAVRATSYLLGFVNYNLGLVLIAAAAGRNRDARLSTLASPFIALNVIDLSVMGIMLLAGLSIGARGHFGQAEVTFLTAAGIGAAAMLPAMLPVSRGLESLIGRRSGFLDTFRALDFPTLWMIFMMRIMFVATDAVGDYAMMNTFNLNVPPAVFAQFFPVDSFACVLPFTVAGIGPTLVLMRVFFGPYVTGAETSGIAPNAVVDAFSVSATTSLILIRTAFAVMALPFAAGIWRSAGIIGNGKSDRRQR